MNPIFYVLSVNGLLFLLSIVFFYFPPKKINSLYGYRTPRTMANDDVWNFANSFFNRLFLKYAGISLGAALLLALIGSDISWQPIAIMVLTLGVCVIKTEQELNQHFDKEGNRIKK